MREFVLKEEQNQNYDSYNRNLRYANFLSKPLNLNMFVPCSEDGVILEDPKDYEHNVKKREYQTALEKLLFEGFEVCKRNSKLDCIFNSELDLHYSLSWMEKETIEDLTKYNLTLTKSAINQLK